MLKLIVGLGNPGKRYETTRHNLGFLVVDAYLGERVAGNVSAQKNLKWQQKFDGLFLDTHLELGQDVPRYWLKPQTFMNLSGRSVQKCAAKLGISPEEILVVYDELDLNPGLVKLKFSGGAGGHNGIKSVIESFGSNDFWRLRLGIGKPPVGFSGGGADWVLKRMNEEELEDAVELGCASLDDVINKGCDKAMQSINSKVRKEERS